MVLAKEKIKEIKKEIYKIYGGYSHAKSEKLRIQEKLQKIEERKQISGSRKQKHLRKYSDNFNKMFMFFLKSYRSGILTFCGSKVDVEFDINGEEGKFCFRKFENGEMNMYNLKSRHPNILKGVVTGKKSWGLWLDQWTDGIVECSFTRKEILGEFEKRKIEIPESLMIDFENVIYKKICKKFGL